MRTPSLGKTLYAEVCSNGVTSTAPRRDRQVRRDVRRDAEAMGVVDDRLNSDAVGQLQRGNVAGLGQRTPKGDGTLKVFVVVVGRMQDLRAVGKVTGASRMVSSGVAPRSMAAV